MRRGAVSNGAARETNGRRTVAARARDVSRIATARWRWHPRTMSEVTLPMPLQPASSAAGRSVDPRARSFFRRSTIQNRLTIAFCALGGMSLIGTLLAIFQLHAMQRDTLADLRAVR